MDVLAHDYRCIAHGLVGKPRCPKVITFEGDCNYGDPCNRVCEPVVIVPAADYRGAVAENRKLWARDHAPRSSTDERLPRLREVRRRSLTDREAVAP